MGPAGAAGASGAGGWSQASPSPRLSGTHFKWLLPGWASPGEGTGTGSLFPSKGSRVSLPEPPPSCSGQPLISPCQSRIYSLLLVWDQGSVEGLKSLETLCVNTHSILRQFFLELRWTKTPTTDPRGPDSRFYHWGSWGFSPLWLLLHTLYPFPSVFSFIPDPGPGDRYLVIQGLLVTVGMGMLSGF